MIQENDDYYKTFNNNDIPEMVYKLKKTKKLIVKRQSLLPQRLFSEKRDLFHKNLYTDQLLSFSISLQFKLL